MRKIVGGLATTLNGIVDSVDDWIIHSPDLDEVMTDGFSHSDAILLGAHTYREFLDVWPAQGDSNPLAEFVNRVPKYIASNSLTTLEWDNCHLLSGDTIEEIRKLRKHPGKDIVIPGSPTLIKSLIRERLLDELQLSIHPLALDEGMDLFDELPTPGITLSLVESRTSDSGVVFLRYRLA